MPTLVFQLSDETNMMKHLPIKFINRICQGSQQGGSPSEFWLLDFGGLLFIHIDNVTTSICV